MTVLKSLSIGKRLAATYSLVSVLFLAVGAMSLYTGGELKTADSVKTHTYVVLGRAHELLASMINMETGSRGFLLSGNEANLAPWTDGQQQFDSNWADLKDLTADNPAQQGRLDEIKARSQAFRSVAGDLIALRKEVTAGTKTMEALTTEFAQGKDKAAMDGFRTFQAAFDKAERDLLAQRAAEVDHLRLLNRLVTLIGSGLALACAVGFGLWISRSITTPINTAVRVAEAVADGNLTMDIQVSGRDETGRLLAALRLMSQNLSRLVGDVRSTSDSIATGSSQIATGNADLSQRTEEQASNLQHTATSMGHLHTTVKNNADTATEATQLAQKASSAATKGGEVVGEVVATMDRIAASSRKISDIISVIDGIAFQTNILALNAAVEAARAGEQGRGFAVVASEVRSLAQRSASAAKEIKTLISESVETVETGARLVSAAGHSMEDIVVQVKQVSDLIQEINTATREQMTGIGQVSDAVAELDQVTQQNASLVEQSAAAAESLKSQANQLVTAVGVFKLT